MSDLTKVEHAVENWFGTVATFIAAHTTDATQAKTQAATNQITAAGQAVDSALPAIAEDLANGVLAKVPAGAEFIPLADELIDLVIGMLTAKKSTVSTATSA